MGAMSLDPPRLNIVLANHNHIAECLAHTDILSCCPRPVEFFVVSTCPLPVDHIWIPPEGHPLGVMLALIAAVREAYRRGWQTFVHRNADDWVMNWDFVCNNWDRFHQGGYKFAGYNWFSVGSLDEFAVNELHIDVETFHEDIGEFERYVREHATQQCEHPLARWVWRKIKPHRFMRINGHEAHGGIGNLWHQHLQENDNNRFYCRPWSLIAGDGNPMRCRQYQKTYIPYRAELEKRPFFRSWAEHAGCLSVKE